MTNQEFIQSIQNPDSSEKYQARYKYIDDLIAYDHSSLKSLFKELLQIDPDTSSIGVNFNVKYLKRDIMSLVSKNRGVKFIETAFDLFLLTDDEVAKSHMISILVWFQNCDQLIEISIQKNFNEALCMIMHEMISQGHDMREHNRYKVLQKINDVSSFKNLSLYPLDQEKELTFKNYTHGESSGFNYSFAHDTPYSPIIPNETEEELKIFKNPKIDTAIDFWPLHLGYNIFEVRSFKGNIIKAIPELMESSEIRLEQLSSKTAFTYLFDACSKGCAYHGGFNGNLGRYKSWQSIEAMIGIKTSQSNSKISSRMKEFDWYRFNTREWFNNEIWDFGLICYDSNTNFCSVIAGSDTD